MSPFLVAKPETVVDVFADEVLAVEAVDDDWIVLEVVAPLDIVLDDDWDEVDVILLEELVLHVDELEECQLQPFSIENLWLKRYMTVLPLPVSRMK